MPGKNIISVKYGQSVVSSMLLGYHLDGWMDLVWPETRGKLRHVDTHVNTSRNCGCGRLAHLTQMPYAPVWT